MREREGESSHCGSFGALSGIEGEIGAVLAEGEVQRE